MATITYLIFLFLEIKMKIKENRKKVETKKTIPTKKQS